MQYLHPMHFPWSTRTTPASSRYDAPVGHTDTQAASSQCLHSMGV